ncbi:hypothetical protein R1flu_003777 [Riccia fluitans]|uniref:NB-ARC domain-containing protein n=1 Tax=Riccia fluitans TaxID=41844 RepID=A0ABD1YCZ8_9MARC
MVYKYRLPTPESVERMSDGFYKFYEPDPAHAATLDIFFFHGLECEGSNPRDSILGVMENMESTPGSRRGRLHVREESSRFGDDYITVSSDHFSVCKPFDRNSDKYLHLKHLIEDVQKRVELERSQSLMVPQVIVGVDVLVTEVLEKHLRDHRFVGFSGLGGVGKTTLAKFIFNKVCAKFEVTCFVEEIKLISGTRYEIEEKVWKKMRHHGGPVQSSSEFFLDGWFQVVGKSMLVVFDDIEDYRHAELLQTITSWNGMDESRFILTSRNTQCLRDCGCDVHIIPLECLEYKDARKLLIAYAFPNQDPPESFEGIIQEIVVGCGGLPLTLEVLGKYLRSEPMEKVWAEIPFALRKCEDIADLEQRVWAKLKLSYDKLPSDEVKNMFLDISCFFILHLPLFHESWKPNDAMKAWSVTYMSAHNHVKILEDRSLLKVSRSKDNGGFDYMEFHLHEHVRRMGQRIAQQKGRSYNFPHSSLQSHDYPYDDQINSQGEKVPRLGEKLNDYIYELYKPAEGPADMDMLLFHGLDWDNDPSDAIHVSTWTCGKGEEAHVWPVTWLSEDFPSVRILAVSYDSHVTQTAEHGRIDLHIAAESLMACLLLDKEWSTSPLRPLILVGHSFGGLLIKQLCIHAHNHQGYQGSPQEKEFRCFLKKISAVLFLGTPHRGMAHEVLETATLGNNSPLIRHIMELNAESAGLHEVFDILRRTYSWRIGGVGELNETTRGSFAGVFVPEASARYGDFVTVHANHLSLSKPTGKDSLIYMRLTALMEVTSRRVCIPENVQTVPRIATVLATFHIVEANRILKDYTCVGLHGMGGIGKTTLAKLIFNNLCANQAFEYSSFISEVKLKSREAVLEAVLHSMHHYGEQMRQDECTWRDLRGQKVLIVFDDVDRYPHLQILEDVASRISSKESRYIVTSRDVGLLGKLRCMPELCAVELYPVPLLDEGSARQLFLSYVVPDPSAEKYVDKILKLCDGLPLSLEVMGKYLHANEGKENIWERSLVALRDGENIDDFKPRLWDILKFSYDNLGNEGKEMFLDCASFFVDSDWRLREAKAAWRIVYSGVADEFWQTLVKTSLVSDVEDDDRIRMHEQLKNLGTKLVLDCWRDQKYSRSWNKRILSKILGIPSKWGRKSRTHSENSSAGRTLQKQVPAISGQLKRCVEKVVAFRHEGSAHITMENICKMSSLRYLDSSVDVIPVRGKKIPCGVVLLRWRGQFASIADVFDPDQTIELTVLRLEAPRLDELPTSFGDLQRLQILAFTSCKFSTLPDSFGELSELQRLEFIDCTKLCKLPESFGDLSSLEVLSFSISDDELDLAIAEDVKGSEANEEGFLPDTFADLAALKNLALYGCRNLYALPRSFSKLESLEDLQIGRCSNLRTLSESFGELPKLRRLDIRCCRSLPGVPDSVGSLLQLQAFCISECESFRAFPATLGDLSKLQSLVISRCKNLHQLPEAVGQLRELEKLEINGTKMEKLPSMFSKLVKLWHLEITENVKLESLPDFGELCLQQHSMSQTGIRGCPSELRHLLVAGCDRLQELHTSLGHLSALQRLEISSLELVDCEHIGALPENFGNMKNLRTLLISQCSIRTLPASFRNLEKLTKLDISNCPLTDLPIGFGNLTSLITFSISYCSVGSLPDSFSELVKLRELEISHCPLREPETSDCRSIDQLWKLVNLRRLTLTNVPWSHLPDSIKLLLPSLDTLTLELPNLTGRCQWLDQDIATLRSYNCFSVKNERFQLIEEEVMSDDEV